MSLLEAWTSNAMVAGMITLSRHIARTLFDLGATHSFISNAFNSKLDRTTQPLKFQLVISTPLGAEVIASAKYKECEIIIGGVRALVDLIKLREWNLISYWEWIGYPHIEHLWIVIRSC